ncbi:MAG: HypC/HybG/HupF family hydrogenase formation chaperone [Rubrivivax sp.]|nr:HypC/HybG/HupF family hydrogenase formation chaperone [Rubrivivax sp.]
MCIGVPMQLTEYGGLHAQAAGRGRDERVDLRLVGECAPGDWVLVFQGAARERLDMQRAAEINAALDLLEQGLGGGSIDPDANPGFALPSAMSVADLAALAGGWASGGPGAACAGGAAAAGSAAGSMPPALPEQD